MVFCGRVAGSCGCEPLTQSNGGVCVAGSLPGTKVAPPGPQSRILSGLRLSAFPWGEASLTTEEGDTPETRHQILRFYQNLGQVTGTHNQDEEAQEADSSCHVAMAQSLICSVVLQVTFPPDSRCLPAWGTWSQG